MERDSIDLGTHEVKSLFRKYLMPTLFGMVSISLVTAADGIFIGQGVGSDGIAAVNICVPLLMIFIGIGLMAGVGSSVVASIHLSRGKKRAARLNVTQAITFITLISIVPSILMVMFPRQAGLLLGSSERLMPYVIDYMVWFMPALVFQLWISIGLFVIRLDGSPKYAMWCSMISAIVNIFLDWLFVFPFGWGLMGAAFATAISIVIGGVMTMYYLLFMAKDLKLLAPKVSKKSLKLSIRNLGYQFRIGSAALLGEATMAMLMFVGNQVFIHYMGEDGVGAFGIACYYTPFIFMGGNAIAQSAQPIISFNYGRGNNHRVVATQRLALITAMICGLGLTAMFIFFPQAMVGLFIDPTSDVAQLAINGFPYFSLGFVFFICNLTVIGYYQSVENISPATSFAFFRGAIFLIPAFIVLPMILGNTGIWLAMPVSEALTFVSIVLYYLYNKKSSPKRLITT